MLGFASAQPKIITIPFRTVSGIILLDATVNDNAAKFVPDTGSSATIVSPQMFSLAQLANDSLGQDSARVGFIGQAKHMRADLKLADGRFSLVVSVMNLADASKHIGTKIAGILGEDLLRTFRAVRIDSRPASSNSSSNAWTAYPAIDRLALKPLRCCHC